MKQWQNGAWQESMRVTYDCNNMMAARVGDRHGIAEGEIDALAGRLRDAQQALAGRRRQGDLGFTELPYQGSVVDDIEAFAAAQAGRWDNLVVVGIGGSALGNIALHTALNAPFWDMLAPSARQGLPALFVLDNVDPARIAALLETVDLRRTLFNVITKSGSTVETMATFLIVRERLVEAVGKQQAEHIVVTTDPTKGDLRRIAEQEGYRSFPIPPSVGGRFSVLSPVGLLSAAMTGVDVRQLLAGAAYMDDICRAPDVWRNPAAMGAALQYLSDQKGKHISVMMPYADSLRDIADWFRQLWAESLGKKLSRGGQVVHVGPTPVKALGATDQHSQIQLYTEGPFDKVVTFLRVIRPAMEIEIPPVLQQYGSLGYLGGASLFALLDAERQATAHALTIAQRPNATLALPEVNAFTIGQLFFLLEMQTALAGELYDVNAFDQPGVEEGKVATYAMMGRPGYEEKRRQIEATAAAAESRYVI